jgi:hypothetical protein
LLKPPPSAEPKLACPSISGTRMEKGYAMRTMASWIAASPCGWHLPIKSPTTRVDFPVGPVGGVALVVHAEQNAAVGEAGVGRRPGGA